MLSIAGGGFPHTKSAPLLTKIGISCCSEADIPIKSGKQGVSNCAPTEFPFDVDFSKFVFFKKACSREACTLFITSAKLLQDKRSLIVL